jgi:hypothetical protein
MYHLQPNTSPSGPKSYHVLPNALSDSWRQPLVHTYRKLQRLSGHLTIERLPHCPSPRAIRTAQRDQEIEKAKAAYNILADT